MTAIVQLLGAAGRQFWPQMGLLRIEVFREFPYLYAGTLGYEDKYFENYFNCPQSLFLVITDGPKVVGLGTGIPLESAEPEWQEPFLRHGYPLEQIFYFGESILLPGYRSQGLGRRLMELGEAYLRSLPGINYATFSSVIRQPDDPRQPPLYQTYGKMWEKWGYRPMPELVTSFSWQDIGDQEATIKKMTMWLRQWP